MTNTCQTKDLKYSLSACWPCHTLPASRANLQNNCWHFRIDLHYLNSQELSPLTLPVFRQEIVADLRCVFELIGQIAFDAHFQLGNRQVRISAEFRWCSSEGNGGSEFVVVCGTSPVFKNLNLQCRHTNIFPILSKSEGNAVYLQ